jgi:hypothetical protein
LSRASFALYYISELFFLNISPFYLKRPASLLQILTKKALHRFLPPFVCACSFKLNSGLGMQISIGEMRKAGGAPLLVGVSAGLLKAVGALLFVKLFIAP